MSGIGYTAYESSTWAKAYGIKCVDIGDVFSREASQTLLTERSQ